MSFPASLPPESLLPLLTSLINAQPSLKSAILSLIPRPTLETAIHALTLSAKKLNDAYPYSNAPSFQQPQPSSSYGFGSAPNGSRSASFANSTVGFGRLAYPQNQPSFGRAVSNHNQSPGNGGMRESYVQSRLRPHIMEYVAAVMSYLPYFSSVPASSAASSSQTGVQSHSTSLHSLHKDKFHPSEAYLFLSAVTKHFLDQPQLTQSSMAPLLLPRLTAEWMAWVGRVDETINKEGGMFGGETVRGWIQGLDEFAATKQPQCSELMRNVRDAWIAKAGWLVGRTVQHSMDEL